VAGLPVLLLFSGLTLELVFRGLVQRGLTEVLGRGGIIAASALFAATFLGTESAGYVVFMGLVGAVFGWSYHRTGSIVGVSLAHGLLNVGLLLVWPAVLG
jgi:membrane protease YdiL (CAAX protease family)